MANQFYSIVVLTPTRRWNAPARERCSFRRRPQYIPRPTASTHQQPTARPLSSRDADHYASCGTHLCSLPCKGSSVIDSAWTGGIDGDALVGDTHYNAHPRFGTLGRGVYMGDILGSRVPYQADADPREVAGVITALPIVALGCILYTMGSALRGHGANTTRPLSWNPPNPPLRDPVLNPGQGVGQHLRSPGSQSRQNRARQMHWRVFVRAREPETQEWPL